MTDSAARSTFDIGRVVESTFGVLGRQFVPFLIISAVLVGVPDLILLGLQRSLTSNTDAAAAALQGVAFLLFTLVKLILSGLLQGALVTGAVGDLNSKPVDLSEMVERGFSVALPLIGLSLLQGLAVVVGFILLFVPGVFLLTIWAVATPSLVIERSGVFGAFSRSADLTRNHRWAILGLLAVYSILAGIVGFILAVVGRGLSGGADTFVHGAQAPGLLLIIANAAVSTLLTMVSATGVAALYYHLRLAKEGVAPQALVDTFA